MLDFDRILEIFLLNVVAVVLGLISDREKASLKSLQEAETLATLGRAISGIVHDMKTPLLAIGGYARSIKKSFPTKTLIMKNWMSLSKKPKGWKI